MTSTVRSDTDTAFATLKRASQNTNTKLRDIATQLITAHEQGEFDTALDRLAATGDLGTRGTTDIAIVIGLTLLALILGAATLRRATA